MTLMGHARGPVPAVPWSPYPRTLSEGRWTRCGTTSTSAFHDRVALEEIDLYADVLSAVAAVDRPLTADELDQVLGVLPIRGLRRLAAVRERLTYPGAANITSVSQWVKPSDSYSPIAAVLLSST